MQRLSQSHRKRSSTLGAKKSRAAKEDEMMVRDCCTCDDYVDCKERVKKMRSIKKWFGTSSRTDIRIRILAMESIGERCEKT